MRSSGALEKCRTMVSWASSTRSHGEEMHADGGKNSIRVTAALDLLSSKAVEATGPSPPKRRYNLLVLADLFPTSSSLSSPSCQRKHTLAMPQKLPSLPHHPIYFPVNNSSATFFHSAAVGRLSPFTPPSTFRSLFSISSFTNFSASSILSSSASSY